MVEIRLHALTVVLGAVVGAAGLVGCGDEGEVTGSSSSTGTGAGGPGTGGAAGAGGGTGVGGGTGAGGNGGRGGGLPYCVVFVDGDNGADTSSGLSWGGAVATIGAGLDAAVAADCPEVWVKEGTYRPTSGADRAASIALAADVGLYGGFAGSETMLDQRDVMAHPTVLSGDIGTLNDGADNSHHVVTGANGARIDGFTITGGRTDGAIEPRGAGLLNIGHDMMVANCRFEDNATGDAAIADAAGGGGIYTEGGVLDVASSQFVNNRTGDGAVSQAIGGSGGPGAGILGGTGATLRVTSSLFEGNTTGDGNDSSQPTGATIGGRGGEGAGIAFVSVGELTVI